MVSPRSNASVGSTESVSDFGLSDDDDDSEGGEFSDASHEEVQLDRKLSALDQMERVSKTIPRERACIRRSIEKHSRSSRLERLEGFVSTLASVAIRNSSRKSDILSVKAIIKAAREIKTRIRTSRQSELSTQTHVS